MKLSFGKHYPNNILSAILGKDITATNIRQLNALDQILRTLDLSDRLLIRYAYEMKFPIDEKFETLVGLKKEDVLNRISEIIDTLSTEENKKLLEEGIPKYNTEFLRKELDDIKFRKKGPEKMPTRAYIDLTNNRMSKSDNYNKFKNYPYPDNLIYYIHNDVSIKITDDIRNGLKHIMNTKLREREREVLRFRFQDHKKVKDIAEYYECSPTRIAQNIKNATRKLRAKDSFIYIDKGMNAVQKEYKSQKDMPIEALELSVRALNCLRRSHFTTASELSNFINTYDGTNPWHFKIRNLGKQTANEIIDVLNNNGFKTKKVFFEEDVSGKIETFIFKEAISDKELIFIVNNEELRFKLTDYDIPDVDKIYLNTYIEDDKTYFIFSDKFDDTSRIISWRLISKLISVVLGKYY